MKCGARSHAEIARRVKSDQEILQSLSEQKNHENWGKISFSEVNHEKGARRIDVTNSFETFAHKTDQPCCHFLRGFLAGFLTQLFKRNTTVSETKCVGKGDEQCEFVFMSTF